MSVPQQIAGYLEDYLDGSLGESDFAKLTSWAHESETNRHALAAWFVTEAELLDASRLSDMRAVFQGLTFDSGEDVNESELRPPARHGHVFAKNAVLVAASVLVALGVAYVWPDRANTNISAGSNTPAGGQVTASNLAPSPAILGRLGNCVWENGMKPIRVGQEIAAGTVIDIKTGLAQLIFESGAEVVLK